MPEKIVRFSRLLRIFEFNKEPAFIIELEENNQKNLYISYYDHNKNIYLFKSQNETYLKKEFKNLSYHCLMSQCTNASYIFNDSPLSHFEADCSSLLYGVSMFSSSSLKSIKTEFPLLKNGSWMFCKTKIKEININFPKLRNSRFMFFRSSLEKITTQFPLLENGEYMFEYTSLKEINCHFPKIKYNNGMFDNTPDELKQNYPHYFV